MPNYTQKLARRLMRKAVKATTKSIEKKLSERKAQKPVSAYKKNAEAVVIAYGRQLFIPVYGEEYGQGKSQRALKTAFANHSVQFSLTPPSDYQIKVKWPEPPFANVGVLGERSSTKDGWLGYIAPPMFDDDIERTPERVERGEYIEKLIALSQRVPIVISGKVIDERATHGTFQLLLMASRKSIDDAFEKYC